MIMVNYDYSIVDAGKQQVLYQIGSKGSGKSNYGELVCSTLYSYGWTVIDLWASDNLENAFWCICKKCKDNPEDEHCNCYRRIPITLLAPDYIIYDQNRVDAYNDRYFSKEPLVKIVKLPKPTATPNTSVNRRIQEIFRDTVLHCRDHRRVLVFNPKMFPDEKDAFRTLDVLIRKLGDIAYHDFNRLEPEDCKPSKKSRDEMTNFEKCFDKIIVLIREFGELAPSSRLKTDQSGQSLLVKKALLQLVRKLRHYQISLSTDFQNMMDVDTSIRSQCDIWTLKCITKRLAGEEWSWLFKQIDDQRKKIAFDYGGGIKGWVKADKWFPKIEELRQNQAYVVYPNDHVRLWDIGTPPFHHKKPFEKWSKITGIEFSFDENVLVAKGVQEEGKTTDKILFSLIFEKRNPKNGKKWDFEKIKDYIADEQEKGNLSWNVPFKNMKIDTFRANYRRWSQKYESEDKQ